MAARYRQRKGAHRSVAQGIASSDALRRRFHGDPSKWPEFVAAYDSELRREPASTAVASLREHLRSQPVTLLYAARDETHNNAVALKAWLERPTDT